MKFRRHILSAAAAATLLFPLSGVAQKASPLPTAEKSAEVAKPIAESNVGLRVVSRDTVTASLIQGQPPVYGRKQEMWPIAPRVPSSPPRVKSTSGSSMTSTTYSSNDGTANIENVSLATSLIQDGGATPQTVTINVLAKEVKCGTKNVAVRLSYRIGSEPAVMLNGGLPLTLESQLSFELPLGQAEPFHLIAGFSPPLGCPPRTRRSDDSNQAFVLTNGADLYALIAAKHVNLTYQGQQPLPSILAPQYLNPTTGEILLPDNESIITFEAENYGAGLAFDMNDLVLRLVTANVAPDGVVYDGLGTGTSATDYQPGLATHILPGYTSYSFPASEFVSAGGILSQFEVVGYLFGSNANPALWDYEIHVWSSWDAVAASLQGDVANYFFYEPTSMDVHGFSPPQANGSNNYRLMFDLSGSVTQLVSGEDYVISVGVHTAPGAAGYFEAATTLLDGPPIKYVTHAGIFPDSGRLGYRLSESLVNGPSGEGSSNMSIGITQMFDVKSSSSAAVD